MRKMKRRIFTTAILFFAVAATAQTKNSSDAVPILGNIPQFHLTTNNLSDAEIQGRNLAKQLYWAQPETNFTQYGLLKVNSSQTNFSIRIIFWTASVTNLPETNWQNFYVAEYSPSQPVETALVAHIIGQPNGYGIQQNEKQKELSTNETAIPFANSDFWICDLGLEFFHWPEQKIIKKEFARGRGCMVLESTNPNPSPGGYSKVDCWIDEESLGIVQAKAYDANGKLLKEFEPKSFKKVNGQWELKDMEIRNVQTGSRTRIEFDLKAK